jgi:hypothetical protein
MAEYSDLQEIGTSGLQRVGGFVIDDFVGDLRGLRGAKVWREMADNDPVVGAMLFAIERLILQIDWRMEPFKEDADAMVKDKDQEVADFVEECMNDMSESWDATLSAIMSFLTYGYAYCEIVYKKRVTPDTTDPTKRSNFSDGKVGWRKIALRAQETTWQWIFDEDGGIKGLQQMDVSAPSHGVVMIPIEKALLFRTSTARNNPEGRSLLRNAYRPWKFKKTIEEIEAVGIERDLAGLPIAYVPPQLLSSNATPAEASARAGIERLIRGIKRNENEGIVFPLAYDDQGREIYKLSLLSSGGSRAFDTDKIVQRYDQRITMTVLADFILLGHEKVGSFALGSTKVDLFTTAIAQIAQSICDVFNQHAIPRLMKMNGMDVARRPKLSFGDIHQINIAELADFIQKASGSGALVVDEGLDEYLRTISGLPPKVESEEGVANNPNVAPPPAQQGQPQPAPVAPSSAKTPEEAPAQPTKQSPAPEAQPAPPQAESAKTK